MKPAVRINYLSFNPDGTALCVGTTGGFSIYSCSASSFKLAYDCDVGSVAIAELLFSSSLVALVGTGDEPSFSPRRLKLFNTKTSSIAGELHLRDAIVAIRLNRDRLIAVAAEKAYVYDLQDLRCLQVIETGQNPRGICAFAPWSEAAYLALPGAGQPGRVLLCDASRAAVVTPVDAHRAPLSALAFSARGDLLATASEKGTVVRVWSVPASEKVYTLRRGAFPASISSLCFPPPGSPGPDLLAVASSTRTLHVFRLGAPSPPSASPAPPPPPPPPPPAQPQAPAEGPVAALTAAASSFAARASSFLARSAAAAASSAAAAVSSRLPEACRDWMECGRDFAHVRLRQGGHAAAPLSPFSRGQEPSTPPRDLSAPSAVYPPSPSFSPSDVPPAFAFCPAGSAPQDVLQVMVATADGLFEGYAMDAIRGGEGRVVAECRLAPGGGGGWADRGGAGAPPGEPPDGARASPAQGGTEGSFI
eukprot:tig00021590_g22778.t1